MAKSKDPIHIKPENKGKFRAEMKAKPGQDISAKREHAAARSAKKRGDVAEEKRAVFAENAKKWKKK